MEQWIGLALVLVGCVIALMGIVGNKWIWRGRRLRWLVRLVGQVGTRVTYIVVGFGLVGAGIVLLIR